MFVIQMEDLLYIMNVYRLQKVLILWRVLWDWMIYFINDVMYSFLGNDQFCGFFVLFLLYQFIKFLVCGFGDVFERLMFVFEGVLRLFNCVFLWLGEVLVGFSCQFGFFFGYRRIFLLDVKWISWLVVELWIMLSIFVFQWQVNMWLVKVFNGISCGILLESKVVKVIYIGICGQ